MEQQSKKIDVMEGHDRVELRVHEHGLVALVDVMPRLVPETTKTADFAIVQAARVSYGEGTKQLTEDRGLIRYLMRHNHTTPFEMVEFKFHHVMPIFIARQWIRHRTANVNEYSARYSVVKDRFYIPTKEDVRQQSNTNKQGGTEQVDEPTADWFRSHISCVSDDAYKEYDMFLKEGVSREQARMLLPQNVYTEWYWKIDLHNLFHFLQLRLHPHAQKEIRDYAEAMYFMVKAVVPIACEAFEDYRLNSISLSRLELDNLNGQPFASTNKRELAEWNEKKTQMGLNPEE